MDNSKRCPLCGSAIQNGECPNCGYFISDSKELDYMTHVMDLEPENYPVPGSMPQKAAQHELSYAAEDVFPPRYAEEQKRNINIQAERFSQPPAAQNNYNYGGAPQQGGIRIDYHTPQNNAVTIDADLVSGKVAETALKALESQYKIPIIIAFELLCPAILQIILAVIMKKSPDVRVSSLGRKTLIVAVLKCVSGFWWL